MLIKIMKILLLLIIITPVIIIISIISIIITIIQKGFKKSHQTLQIDREVLNPQPDS